jgi:hypothetical protein
VEVEWSKQRNVFNDLFSHIVKRHGDVFYHIHRGSFVQYIFSTTDRY